MYDVALNENGWSEHYNVSLIQEVMTAITTGEVQVWSEELKKIIGVGESCLEIGCGTGISTLWLAKNGRIASAIDYTQSSVELVKTVAEKLGVSVDVILGDATKPLPFDNKQFDYIFQSGLLEHFSTEEQIMLLKNWKKHSRRMISMIPNKSSVPYRIGKEIMEKNGEWRYGLEIPKHSLVCEFKKAGITVENEYTIGTEWALRFLPKDHFVRKMYKQLINEGFDLDEMMQGYLLVTIGKC